jgi:cation:H+ antiporter
VTILMLIAGLGLLIVGGELLVRGASKLAVSLGISPLVVGLTVVAFGTSAPEFAVSVQAALSGQVDIALGNVVGSNIFNVLFILGLSALIVPLVVSAQIVRQEVPIMIGASLLLAAFALDGSIVRWEAGCCSRCCSSTRSSWSSRVVASRRRSRPSTPANHTSGRSATGTTGLPCSCC